MRKQPLANTSAICEKIDALREFKAKNWYNFNGDASTFTDIDAELKREYDYLVNMWKNNSVDEKRFSLWDAMPAFYDIPDHVRDYTLASYRDGHGRKVTQTITKYDILHDREDYLKELRYAIASLFHDWQFTKYGWTAY